MNLLRGFENSNNKIYRIESITKIKAIVEHQIFTREKYFIPILITLPEDMAQVMEKISLRKGDVIVNLGKTSIILLEKGRKCLDDAVSGFINRFKTETGFEFGKAKEKLFKILDEKETLKILDNIVPDFESKKIVY